MPEPQGQQGQPPQAQPPPIDFSDLGGTVVQPAAAPAAPAASAAASTIDFSDLGGKAISAPTAPAAPAPEQPPTWDPKKEVHGAYLRRLRDWNISHPAEYLANVHAQNARLKEGLRSAGPYAAAGAGAAALTASGQLEALPWYAALLARMGVGAATGAATQGIANVATGHPAAEDVPETAAWTGGGEGAGGLIDLGAKGLLTISRLAKGGMIPEDILKYMTKIGVSPTTGERLGPGIISSGENVISGTAVGTKSATRAMLARQAALKAEAARIADTLSSTGISPPTAATRGTSADAIQSLAHEGLSDIDLASQGSINRVASAAAPGNITPLQAGQQIIDAVRGQFNQSQGLESAAYQSILPQIEARGVATTGDTTRAAASSMLSAAEKVESVIGKPPAAEGAIYDSLRALSGQGAKDQVSEQLYNGLTYDALDAQRRLRVDNIVAAHPQQVPFNTFWKARQEFGARIGSLERSGAIDDKRLRAVNKVYDAMTADLMSSLPADLRPQFQSAINITKQQKADFGADIIRSMLHPDNPMAGEKVVDTLLKQGNESDWIALNKIIGRDPQGLSTIRSAAKSWLQKNVTSPEATLKLLDSRPQLRSILGPGYDNFITAIKSQAAAESTKEFLNYKSFLSTFAKGEDSSVVIKKIAESPYYAQQVSRLIPPGSPIRAQLATDLLMHTFDAATEGGSYSLPGARLDGGKLLQALRDNESAMSKFIPQASISAYKDFAQSTLARDTFNKLLEAATSGGAFGDTTGSFSPRQFAGKWSELRPSVARIMSPSDLANIDKFANAAKFLTFTPNITANASRFGTLRQIGLLANVPISLLMGASPITALASEAGAVLGPKAFMAAALNPDFAEFMANGIRMPASPMSQTTVKGFAKQAGKWVPSVVAKVGVKNAGSIINLYNAYQFLNSMSESGRQIPIPAELLPARGGYQPDAGAVARAAAGGQ